MKRNEEIVERILGNNKRSWQFETTDPFKSLVRTILSQNTNGRNQTMAFRRLESTVGITPENIAGVDVRRLREAIRPAGMHNQRSNTLKSVADAVIQKFDGDLSPVMDKPYPEARRILMSLPGVGPKTADVVLMFVAGKEIVPVDRHIFRISKRLGIVPDKAAYDEVRLTLEAATPLGRREDVHVLLIQFGKEICRAQKPKCLECFLNDLCPYPEKSG